ncbi:DUF1800 family protein, partial [Mesorhizobium sp.]|uniref:DUF1800 family protein n=1 Tax=Mesorhizobium sp. TaxID=1871066 RepID=UPI000FE8921A
MAAPVSNSVRPDPALVALHRFGLGARPGDDFGKIAADPRSYLKAELKQQDIALISPDDPRNAGLLDSTAAIQASMAAALERKAARSEKAPAVMQPMAADDLAGPANAKAKPAVPRLVAIDIGLEAQARFDKALAAAPGFVERLVGFWSNHFCVSIAKAPVVRASAGAFEREAIRPFVLGRFADMLLAVEHHPAMLFYLDN